MPLIVFDSEESTVLRDTIKIPRIVAELYPGKWRRWGWEIRAIHDDDACWTHYWEYDGRARGFKKAIMQASDAADDLWTKLFLGEETHETVSF